MKPQLYTFTEIIDTLRQLAKGDDNLTALLEAGHFKWKFESHVSEQRAKRYGNVLHTLTDRLTSTNHNGQNVYILDDIQAALTKQQFDKFMKFIRQYDVTIDSEKTTYIPANLVDLFIQNEQDIALPESTPEPDEVAEPMEKPSVVESSNEPNHLKFA
ncbi:MAG: hypothetical protein M3R24_11585 [Chloroflexota bacterium]|nr:hypothetical protein [Chloroflexota bacterium]